MSDDSPGRILAAIEQLRSDLIGDMTSLQIGLTAEITRTRTDMMARMDRLQGRLNNLDEHLTMGLGYADRVDKRSSAVSEDNRLLGELLMSLTHIVRRLEGRINDLEDKP